MRMNPPVDLVSCGVCPRCQVPTGNETVTHYWSQCRVSGRLEEFHYCCPRHCELHPEVTT
jgi:hypothetical protein